jgi:DNA-binding MarR family transcriptional regulator
MPERRISDRDYVRLLAVRTGLRRFEHWSADQAAGQGLTSSQHQLLLAIRGHEGAAGPTITNVADHLFIRHHSAVELVDRTEQAGLLARHGDPDDHRVVRLRLTATGRRKLAALSGAHIEELASLTPILRSMIHELATD